MIMKISPGVALILTFAQFSFGQQEPETDLYWNRMVHYNPASIGINEKTAINIHGRNQWVGMNDHPITISFNAAQKLESIHGAFGVSFEHDQIGNSNMQVAMFNYAFHLPIKECILSIGASAGIGRYHSEANWIPPQTITDENLPQTFTDYNLHTDLGLIFHHSNFNVGASITQLNQPTYSRNTSQVYQAVAHLNAFADYTIKFGDHFSLKPQCMVMTDAVKMNVNAALMAIINDKIWFGGNYSNENTFGAFAGYDFFNRLRVGYGISYIKTLNLSTYSHEAVLSFLLKN